MEKHFNEAELPRIAGNGNNYKNQEKEICATSEITLFEAIQNKINEFTKVGINSLNGQTQNNMLQQSEALLWVLKILSVEAAESFAVIEDKK